MLCLFAIFNFWRAIFYSWTTTLFWTWILFSCLFCFHSYLLFSLYFYYLQFDFNYAKFVEKIINNLIIALVMCLFCIIARFCLWDSSTLLGMTAHQRVQAGRSAPASKMCVALFWMYCTFLLMGFLDFARNDTGRVTEKSKAIDRWGLPHFW